MSEHEQILEENHIIAKAIGGVFRNHWLLGEIYIFPDTVPWELHNKDVKFLDFQKDYNRLIIVMRIIRDGLIGERLQDEFDEQVLSLLGGLCQCDTICTALVYFIKTEGLEK